MIIGWIDGRKQGSKEDLPIIKATLIKLQCAERVLIPKMEIVTLPLSWGYYCLHFTDEKAEA